MKRESDAVLLRIFFGEKDRYDGQPLYKYLVRYLRENHFSGATVLRGMEGFGHRSIVHSADFLDLSSDLPLVIEVVDTEEKMATFKKHLDENKVLNSGLLTEERVTIVRYGSLS